MFDFKMDSPVEDIAQATTRITEAMKDMVVVLEEGLKGAGGKFTYTAVGDMVIRTGLLECSKLVAEILTTIFTGQKKEDSDSPLVKAESVQQDTQSKTT